MKHYLRSLIYGPLCCYLPPGLGVGCYRVSDPNTTQQIWHSHCLSPQPCTSPGVDLEEHYVVGSWAMRSSSVPTYSPSELICLSVSKPRANPGSSYFLTVCHENQSTSSAERINEYCSGPRGEEQIRTSANKAISLATSLPLSPLRIFQLQDLSSKTSVGLFQISIFGTVP